MSKRLLIVLALITVICAMPSLGAAAPERLVVRDLEGRDVGANKALVLTDLLISDLESSGKFKIFSRAEVQAILDTIAERQQFDPECDTEKCILEIGNALGADRVLSGNVGRMGGVFMVTLTLHNMSTGAKEARQTWKCDCDETELMKFAPSYGREIMGLADSGESGVKVSEGKKSLLRNPWLYAGAAAVIGGGVALTGGSGSSGSTSSGNDPALIGTWSIVSWSRNEPAVGTMTFTESRFSYAANSGTADSCNASGSYTASNGVMTSIWESTTGCSDNQPGYRETLSYQVTSTTLFLIFSDGETTTLEKS